MYIYILIIQICNLEHPAAHTEEGQDTGQNHEGDSGDLQGVEPSHLVVQLGDLSLGTAWVSSSVTGGVWETVPGEHDDQNHQQGDSDQKDEDIRDNVTVKTVRSHF